MYDNPIETVDYILVNISCMIDWILWQNGRNTLPLHVVDHLVRSVENEMIMWLAGIKFVKVKYLIVQDGETRICLLEAELKIDASQTVNK